MGEKMSLWVGFAGAFTAWGSSTEPAETGEAAGAGDGMPGEYAGPRRSLSSVSPRPSSNSLTSEPFSSSRISRISFRFIGIPSHALDVGSGTRVHLDHVPLVQEEGDRHEGAGLQPRRLGRSAHRVSAETGLGFHDLQVDEERNVDPDRLPPVEEDLHGKVLDQVVPRLRHVPLVEIDLFVRARVHEVELVLHLVHELHVALFEVRLLDLVAAAEGVLDDRAGLQVLDFRADEGTPLAGLDVLEVDDDERASFELDLQPVAEIRRGVHPCVRLLRPVACAFWGGT